MGIIATSVISFCGYNIQYIQIYHKIKILRYIDHMYMIIHLVQPINDTTWPYISCKIEKKRGEKFEQASAFCFVLEALSKYHTTLRSIRSEQGVSILKETKLYWLQKSSFVVGYK